MPREVKSWRFGEDGTDVSWVAVCKTAISGEDCPKGTKQVLLMQFANTETKTNYKNDTYRIEYRRNGGAWTTLGASNHWQVYDATAYTDEAAVTTNNCSSPGYTWVNGVKDDSGQTGSFTLDAGEYTEMWFACQSTTYATPGATYEFRLYCVSDAVEVALGSGVSYPSLVLGTKYYQTLTNKIRLRQFFKQRMPKRTFRETIDLHDHLRQGKFLLEGITLQDYLSKVSPFIILPVDYLVYGYVRYSTGPGITGATVRATGNRGTVTTTTLSGGYYQINIREACNQDGESITVLCEYAGQSDSSGFTLNIASQARRIDLTLQLLVGEDVAKPQVFVSGVEVPNVFEVSWEEPKASLTDVPQFEILTDNITGRRMNSYNVNEEVIIYRHGEVVFKGLVEPREFNRASSGSVMKVGGPHYGYAKLQQRVCDYYRADNNSYAPVVNPWQFGRLTTTANALVDGLRPDEIMQCLIGVKFIWQEWFDSHDFLKFSTTSAQLAVIDGVLCLPKSNNTGSDPDDYATSGKIQSIGLYNGDKYVDPMGNISTVTATIIGAKYSSYNVNLYVCRNADEGSPTWHAVSLTFNGSNKWTGSYTFADSPVYKNQFGYILSLNGDGNGTTEVEYARFDCITVSDTSITAGTIDQYNDPNTDDDTVAVNLAGMTRLEALEKVRLMTNASTEYADINWDAYIDNDLKFHFSTIRGEDQPSVFSFSNRNLSSLIKKEDGKIVNALIALGQGEEPYAVTLTGSELQDSASISEYGQKTGYFIDKSIPDAPTLYKRAKAYLKYMKDPRESIEVKLVNDPDLNWSVGDRITIRDTELNVDDLFRVVSKKITWTQEGDEAIDIELATKHDTVGSLFRDMNQRFTTAEVISQGTGAPSNTLAAGLAFDTTQFAEYPFVVPAHAQRITISAKTYKYRAYEPSSIETFDYYPEQVGMRIDMTTGGYNQKFGLIGKESESGEVLNVDITNELRDANGKIETGLHTLYFNSQPSTNNPNGLGIISVSHSIIVVTSEEIDTSPLP